LVGSSSLVLCVFYMWITDSVTRSPLYSMYGESISGVTVSISQIVILSLAMTSFLKVLRAYGASTKVLREMLQHVDTVCPLLSQTLIRG
jgi:hypothetical protein